MSDRELLDRIAELESIIDKLTEDAAMLKAREKVSESELANERRNRRLLALSLKPLEETNRDLHGRIAELAAKLARVTEATLKFLDAHQWEEIPFSLGQATCLGNSCGQLKGGEHMPCCEVEILRAALSDADDSMVLVPRVPTDRMLEAGNDASLSIDALMSSGRYSCVAATWKAMLAARKP